MLMEQENFGNSSLRFKLEDADQQLAFTMLSKIQRKQTGFVTALICDYLESNNINPYMFDSKVLNAIVNAYMNARKNGNTITATVPTSSSLTAEPATAIEPKPKKKYGNSKQEEKIIQEELIKENDKEEVVDEMIDDEDFSAPTDEEISQVDLLNAMQSLNNFY